MATTNSKLNGALLGGAFGALLAFLVQQKVPALWNGVGSLSNSIIGSWSGFSSLSTNFVTYALFIIVGLLIGLYIEYK